MSVLSIVVTTLAAAASPLASVPIEFPDIPATSAAIDAEIVRLGWAFPAGDTEAAARWDAYAELLAELLTELDASRTLLDNSDSFSMRDLREASI